jgi:hypothetical protein
LSPDIYCVPAAAGAAMGSTNPTKEGNCCVATIEKNPSMLWLKDSMGPGSFHRPGTARSGVNPWTARPVNSGIRDRSRDSDAGAAGPFPECPGEAFIIPRARDRNLYRSRPGIPASASAGLGDTRESRRSRARSGAAGRATAKKPPAFLAPQPEHQGGRGDPMLRRQIRQDCSRGPTCSRHPEPAEELEIVRA